MHTEIVRCLRIRHASLFDQPHRLKLELACKLPPFHDSPPVPSKHLTRCLRNRVQARRADFSTAEIKANLSDELDARSETAVGAVKLIIDASCSADHKTKSRWGQALRYVWAVLIF